MRALNYLCQCLSHKKYHGSESDGDNFEVARIWALLVYTSTFSAYRVIRKGFAKPKKGHSSLLYFIIMKNFFFRTNFEIEKLKSDVPLKNVDDTECMERLSFFFRLKVGSIVKYVIYLYPCIEFVDSAKTR